MKKLGNAFLRSIPAPLEKWNERLEVTTTQHWKKTCGYDASWHHGFLHSNILITSEVTETTNEKRQKKTTVSCKMSKLHFMAEALALEDQKDAGTQKECHWLPPDPATNTVWGMTVNATTLRPIVLVRKCVDRRIDWHMNDWQSTIFSLQWNTTCIWLLNYIEFREIFPKFTWNDPIFIKMLKMVTMKLAPALFLLKT